MRTFKYIIQHVSATAQIMIECQPATNLITRKLHLELTAKKEVDEITLFLFCKAKQICLFLS